MFLHLMVRKTLKVIYLDNDYDISVTNETQYDDLNLKVGLEYIKLIEVVRTIS